MNCAGAGVPTLGPPGDVFLFKLNFLLLPSSEDLFGEPEPEPLFIFTVFR